MTQGQFIESLVFTAKTCLLTNNMCHYFCYILAISCTSYRRLVKMAVMHCQLNIWMDGVIVV